MKSLKLGEFRARIRFDDRSEEFIVFKRSFDQFEEIFMRAETEQVVAVVSIRGMTRSRVFQDRGRG
jgi:hypothetical protein